MKREVLNKHVLIEFYHAPNVPLVSCVITDLILSNQTRGNAFCDKSDVFDLKRGKLIALERAYNRYKAKIEKRIKRETKTLEAIRALIQPSTILQIDPYINRWRPQCGSK